MAIGFIDVAGGFDGWYNAWNSAEISYKTTGVAMLPIITSPTFIPITIGENK